MTRLKLCMVAHSGMQEVGFILSLADSISNMISPVKITAIHI